MILNCIHFSNVYSFYYKKQLSFSLGTDDDHRVALKSISERVDCEHDYINATYIDVRPLKICTWLLKIAPDRFMYHIDQYNDPLYTLIHLTLRVILNARSTLPPKVITIMITVSKVKYTLVKLAHSFKTNN